MKRLTKKLVAALLSGTMILGMSMTTFAADPEAVSVTDTKTAVTKTWTAAENGLLNDTEEFEFTLTYNSKEDVGSNVAADPSYKESPMGAGTVATVTISDNWKTNAGNDGVSSSSSIDYATLFDDVTFSTPGLYTFKLSEVAGDNKNIKYDTKTYTIQVQVVWETDANKLQTGNLKINKITVSEGDVVAADKKVNGATFTNTPADTQRLTVSKSVAGSAANKNDVFDFTVLISGEGVSGTYSTSLDGKTVTAGTPEKFTLSHAKSFTVNNLPAGATYTVVETDDRGYTSTTINGIASDNKTATGTIANGNVRVSYVNTKEAISITGIALNYGPYVLIFGVALMGCFVFFRRRRRF